MRAQPAPAPSSFSTVPFFAIKSLYPRPARDDPVHANPPDRLRNRPARRSGCCSGSRRASSTTRSGPTAPRNDHYMADLATFYLALGAVALVAVRRASWRVPVLALALIQYALHSLNHLIDIGESDPVLARPRRTSSPCCSPRCCSAGCCARRARRRDEGVRGRRERRGGPPAGAEAGGSRPRGHGHDPLGGRRPRTCARPARVRVVDVFDADALRAAMAEAPPEVIVHQLTALPERIDFRKADTYAATNRVRTEGTRNLIDAARAAGARRFVCQSIAFAYRTEGGGVKTENDPLLEDAPGAFGSGVSALREMEAMVLGTEGLDGLVLRYGFFYGPGTYYARTARSTRTCAGGACRSSARAPACSRSSTWTTPRTPRWPRSSAARRASTTSPTTSPPPMTEWVPGLGEGRRREAAAAGAGVAGEIRRPAGGVRLRARAARRLEREGEARARLAAGAPELAQRLRGVARRLARDRVGDRQEDRRREDQQDAGRHRACAT